MNVVFKSISYRKKKTRKFFCVLGDIGLGYVKKSEAFCQRNHQQKNTGIYFFKLSSCYLKNDMIFLPTSREDLYNVHMLTI